MKYMGSKARHAKEILPIILEGRKPGQWYVEPFVGGANVIDKVTGLRMASDVHPHLIVLLDALSNGWTPPDEVTEDQYKDAQRDRHLDPMTAFIGFCASYSGKWFGGFARGNDLQGGARNYASEAKRNLLKQAKGLHGVSFHCKPYSDVIPPKSSLIYCDPPYAGTTNYSVAKFDHSKFWKWCDDRSSEGHTVFVSEYTAPAGWECVWEKRVNNTLVKNTGSKQGVERLFRPSRA